MGDLQWVTGEGWATEEGLETGCGVRQAYGKKRKIKLAK
jgi:hypothetical protein